MQIDAAGRHSARKYIAGHHLSPAFCLHRWYAMLVPKTDIIAFIGGTCLYISKQRVGRCVNDLWMVCGEWPMQPHHRPMASGKKAKNNLPSNIVLWPIRGSGVKVVHRSYDDLFGSAEGGSGDHFVVPLVLLSCLSKFCGSPRAMDERRHVIQHKLENIHRGRSKPSCIEYSTPTISNRSHNYSHCSSRLH